MFTLSGVERPEKKATQFCRVIGMNRGQDFNAPKQDITQTSDHSVSDNNEADMSYFSQIPCKVMLAMSGFCKGNNWLINRSYINHFPIQWKCLLFPHSHQWTTERESDDGDKTKASASILCKTTPYLARLFVQDGKFSTTCVFNYDAHQHFFRVFAVARYPDHDMSKILLSMIGPTHYSFVHQTLYLIKTQDSVPRQVQYTPQELFLTCDINILIALLLAFNSIMRHSQSNNNPIVSLNDNNQPLIPSIPLINFSNASCVKCKRPPLGMQVTIAKVVEHWIVNACDDKLDVMNLSHLKRKTWMKEKGMSSNFNKCKSIIEIVDRRVSAKKIELR